MPLALAAAAMSLRPVAAAAAAALAGSAFAAGRPPHQVAIAGRGAGGDGGGLHAAAHSAVGLWEDYRTGLIGTVPVNIGLVTLQLTLPMFFALVTFAFIGAMTLIVLALCALAATIGKLTRGPSGGSPARGPPPRGLFLPGGGRL